MPDALYLPPSLAAEPYDIDRVCEQLAGCGYCCVSGLFPDDLLDDLAAEARALDGAAALAPAGVGRGEAFRPDARVRTDRTRWIDGDSEVQARFLAALEQLRVEVNRRLLLGIYEVEAHYAVYAPGAYYQRHLDSFRGARNRLLTLVLYLNRDWGTNDGGELVVFAAGDNSPAIAAVAPEHGRAVIFLSETIPHEVLPTHRPRYSIAVWYRCRGV